MCGVLCVHEYSSLFVFFNSGMVGHDAELVSGLDCPSLYVSIPCSRSEGGPGQSNDCIRTETSKY